ncbi:MAG TPA: hypothetical protein VG754_09445, partial [Verrucomicrobiae bacterium]|nr:hypothetical protein [Verrucomicrobiae bacterium]
MKGKRLITCGLLALLLLVAVNALIARAARVSLRRQFLTRLEALPQNVDCMFLGNSLVEAGCDANAFIAAWPDKKHPPVAVNLGLGATTPVEHYLVLKQALARCPHPKYLIYGFFDDQLNQTVNGRYCDLVGNRAFSYYFPEDAAAFYTPGSRFEAWKMRVIGHIPMLAERSSLWGKVELLRRRISEIGMPHQKINRFGRVSDFANLEAQDVPSFIQRCESIVRERKDFSPPIREILRLAREHGVTVFLVEMPMPTQHRKLFYSLPAWQDLRAHLQTLATREHAYYIPASDWVADDNKFEDAVHLNERGAAFFSDALAPSITAVEQHQTPTFLHASQST